MYLNLKNTSDYHKDSSLKGGGGVHYALQDDGLQLFRVHLIWG